MTQKCFDEGTIQAFLDGELSSDLAEKVACHAADCESCTTVLATAEEESAFAFAALDAEFNVLVPTERIRTRLFETIAAEKPTYWQRLFGMNFRLSSLHIAAFASVVFILFSVTILLNVRRETTNETFTARVEPTTNNAAAPVKIDTRPTAENSALTINVAAPASEAKQTVEPRRVVAAREPSVRAERAVYQPSREDKPKPDTKRDFKPLAPESADYTISGEETYLRTIATLKQTVDHRRDETMRPSARVEFEKDMAVVNDAIDRMRKEVRKNPKNEAAKDVLRATYQNKIDLLNSVAEKNELMASLK